MEFIKFIFATIVATSTLIVNAENSFFIEDFSIGAGETKELAINLTNEVTYTGFQADVYLPEGMEFVYNEDELGYAWPNYDRVNFRTHTWSSEIRQDGSLRILCYSTQNKLFSGNEGALMYITVQTSADFIGNHQIRISQIKFAEIKEGEDPIDHILPETITEVTGPSTEPAGIPLTLNVANCRGTVNMYVENNSIQFFKFVADEGYKLHTVTFNGEDVTENVNEYNVYKTPTITEASVIGVAFEIVTDVEEIAVSDRVKVTAINGYINVNGTIAGEQVYLYTSDGVLLNSAISNGDKMEFEVNAGKIYIVKTLNHIVKVMM